MARINRTRLFTTLASLLERIPVGLAVRIASVVGSVLSLRDSAARRTVERNVTTILTERSHGRAPDAALVRRYVRRNFASYARYWAEGATLPRIDRHELLSQISIIEGEPVLRAAMAAGNGVILALPHIGSWEWGGAYLAALGLPMTAVAERLEPEELFQFFVTKRNAMGLGVVPLDEGATGELSRILRSGGLVGLLCDRDLMGGGQPAQLFGEPVTIPKGPATLALRSGAALFVGVVYSGPGSAHYAIIEGPLNTHRADGLRKDVERVTSDIVAHLDGLIGRAPEQWHVFQPIFTSEGDAR